MPWPRLNKTNLFVLFCGAFYTSFPRNGELVFLAHGFHACAPCSFLNFFQSKKRLSSLALVPNCSFASSGPLSWLFLLLCDRFCSGFHQSHDLVDQFLAELLVEFLMAHEQTVVDRAVNHVGEKFRVDLALELASGLGFGDHLRREGAAMQHFAVALSFGDSFRAYLCRRTR